jgi:hypothetical protein
MRFCFIFVLIQSILVVGAQSLTDPFATMFWVQCILGTSNCDECKFPPVIIHDVRELPAIATDIKNKNLTFSLVKHQNQLYVVMPVTESMAIDGEPKKKQYMGQKKTQTDIDLAFIEQGFALYRLERAINPCKHP